MILKRIISIMLVFMVLLSPTDYLSFDDIVPEVPQDQSTTQVFERTHDGTDEFRESIKFNLSEETKFDAHVISHKPLMHWFNAFHRLQYNCYQFQFLYSKSSNKLFIDFGALII